MKRLLHSVACLLLLCFAVLDVAAQQLVTGKVTDKKSGTSIQGARVEVKGTKRGTITNKDGEFKVSVSPNTVLVVSYSGYKRTEINVGNNATVSVALAEDRLLTDEVVVTALGVDREKRTVGYSVETVKGEALTQARESNVINGLAGRVAGVQINNTAAGAGASTRVVIRGAKQINGDNQPLYVVDGIPIDNSSPNQAGNFGGTDFGDGISSINPDDIETMTVLKGAAATALYGTRAQNGAIVITTKKGTNRKGIGVEYNGNFVFETPLVLPEYQNEYGHGRNNLVPTNLTDVLAQGTGSWGARMDGRDAIFFDGVTRPYLPQPNSFKDFYQTGQTQTHTVSMTGGNETSNFRVSLSNMQNIGMVPNTSFQRSTISLRGQSSLSDRLTVDAKVNWILEDAPNRPSLSDAADNPARSLNNMPRSVNVNWLKTYKRDDGSQILFSNDVFSPNPYWSVNENRNPSLRERLISVGSLRFQATDELAIMVRVGRDGYNFRQSQIDPIGTSNKLFGDIQERNIFQEEINADFLLTFDKQLTEDIRFNANVGGNLMSRKGETIGAVGTNFILPNLLVVNNTVTQVPSYGLSRKKINSLYGAAQISYKSFLTLEATARNDWSSTLPSESRSYFYPSVNTAFTLSEAVALPSFINYAKLRASFAQVGGDTDPYQLSLFYTNVGTYTAGRNTNVSLFQPSGFTVPLSTLKPTRSNNLEFGLDMKFLDGLFALDVTYYSQVISDQILPTNISTASGFTSALINAGEMQNNGIEFILTAFPVRTDDFTWEINLNGARNWNKVNALIPGLDRLNIGAGRGGASVFAFVGQTYGAIVGSGYMRDPNNNIVFDAGGFPMVDPIPRIIGNSTPTFIGGIQNTFTYGNFSFGFLLDFRFGAQMYSLSNAQAYINGQHPETLPGRETGITGIGVVNAGTAAAPNFVTNTLAVAPANMQTYYSRIGGIAEPFIYDAAFGKLREVIIGYRVPESVLRDSFAGSFLTGVNVSFVMRNALLFMNNVPGVDPESSYNNTNGQGLEHNTLPTTRSFGFNVSLKF